MFGAIVYSQVEEYRADMSRVPLHGTWNVVGCAPLHASVLLDLQM